MGDTGRGDWGHRREIEEAAWIVEFEIRGWIRQEAGFSFDRGEQQVPPLRARLCLALRSG